MKIIFYPPNTTHEWFRFKKRFEVSKMSCRTWNEIPFQIDFFPHYIDLRDIAFPVFVRQKYWKKNYITQTIVCRLIVSVLQTSSVFSLFLLVSSSFNPKLSVNPIKLSEVVHFQDIPKKPLSGESSGSKNFSPSGAVRDKNPLWAWAVIFVTFAHARLDVRNFLTSDNGCFQSPSFPNHVTKKRRALGTRMHQTCLATNQVVNRFERGL